MAHGYEIGREKEEKEKRKPLEQQHSSSSHSNLTNAKPYPALTHGYTVSPPTNRDGLGNACSYTFIYV